MVAHGQKPLYHEIHKLLMNSRGLSGDVAGALDPDFQDVHEKRNAARLGYGICLTKFTGSRGKYGGLQRNRRTRNDSDRGGLRQRGIQRYGGANNRRPDQ